MPSRSRGERRISPASKSGAGRKPSGQGRARAPAVGKPPFLPAGEGLRSLIGRKVVLDTQGPVMYLGTLRSVASDGCWLEDADIRDRSEGHVTKERYACEAKSSGIRANRRRIFVCSSAVISASALDDIIVEFVDDAV